MESTCIIRIIDLLPGEYEADVECKLRSLRLGDHEHYEALSYVWGNENNMKTITVSDQRVNITETLFLALKRLRCRHSIRRLWVDQLCIMQWDVNDKTRQVNMMRQIYSNCARCLIWIGEVEKENGITFDDAETAFDFINLCAQSPRHAFSTPSVETDTNAPDSESTRGTLQNEVRVFSDWDIPPSLSSPVRRKGGSIAFSKLTAKENPWWSRIWTVQEAVLPQKALLHWGRLSIPWETVETAASNLCSLRIPIPPSCILEAFGDSIHHLTGAVRGLLFARNSEDPLDLLQRWRYRRSTDPRDKVYALMGLYAVMPLLHVQSCDYDISVTSLYVKVTYDLICLSQNLRPFVGLRVCSTPNLPSWAIDLACCPDTEPWLWWWNHSHRYSWYKADGGKPLRCKPLQQHSALSLVGVTIDVIVEIGTPLTLTRGHNFTTEALVETIMAWYQTFAGYMCHQPLNRQNPYGNTWSTAFWRTVIADLIMDEFPIRRATLDAVELVKSYCQSLSWSEVCPSLQSMVPNQSFFITEKGYIGLGPPDLTTGDEIWVLYGGNVPFVLRRKPGLGGVAEGKDCPLAYTLIGDAYLHGAMDGEAVDRFRYTERDIHLY